MTNKTTAVAPAAHLQNTVAAMLGIPAQASAEELLEIGIQAFNASGLWMARAGAAFRALKADSERSESSFKEMLKARGIAEQRAYEAIGYAEFLERLPEDQARRLLAVPHTKVMALAKADPEVVAELLEVGALDGDEPLTVRELRERLHRAERANAGLQNELDIANNQKKLLARAGHALQDEVDLPPFALAVRQEAMALTAAMSFDLDNLEAICAEHLFQEIRHPEAPKYQPIAAATAYFSLAGIHARSQELLAKLRAEYESALGNVSIDHQLTPAEIKRYQEQRAQLLAAASAKATARANERENNRPGKRGAKRK